MSKIPQACAVFLLALWAASWPAGAATIHVDSTDDKNDNADGACSLREAVQASLEDKAVDTCAAGSGADIIDFIGKAAGGTIEILKKEDPIHLSSDLTIQGPVTISGAKHSRIFEVGTAIDLHLKKLTLTKAFEDGGGGALAIFGAGGTTEIADCKFTENEVTELGGAVLGSGGTIKITGSTFSLNQAGTRGGALSGGGDWTIEDSSFTNNKANGGGAIYCSSGKLDVRRSSFQLNTAVGDKTPSGYADGGGAVMDDCLGTLENDLFEVNNADGRVGGGALLVRGSGGERAVRTSVFRGNMAYLTIDPKIDGLWAGGGAIHV